jgi:hypothetical protein
LLATWVAAAVLLVSQLWLAWEIWPEVQRLPDHVKELEDRYPNDRVNPRFWSHGWFAMPPAR